jgi:hypothetical protein
MNNASEHDFVCRIDASSTIVAAGDNWSDLLRQNSPANDAAPYIGKRLWSHLGNSTAVNLFQALVAKARRTGNVVEVPCRSDSPGKSRHLEVRIRPLPAGVVEFQSVLIREEPSTMATTFIGRPVYSGESIRMCSWCKRIAAPEWAEVDVAIRRLKLLESDNLHRVTHSICPDCAEAVIREMKSG